MFCGNSGATNYNVSHIFYFVFFLFHFIFHLTFLCFRWFAISFKSMSHCLVSIWYFFWASGYTSSRDILPLLFCHASV